MIGEPAVHVGVDAVRGGEPGDEGGERLALGGIEGPEDVGVLLLGRFFAWADIAAYLAGIALATVADRPLSRSNGMSRDAD